MIRLLAANTYRVMPWKIGRGTTTEIFIHPEGAGWDNFLWRVGIADIAQSGPFSSFPGIDRSIMLLDCPQDSAMALTVDGARAEMVLHEFIDFPGEAKTCGELRGKAVRDFNVMSRRGAIQHRRGWKALAAHESFALDGSDSRFVHVIAGDADLMGAAPEHAILAGGSVIVSGEDNLRLRGGSAGTQLVWAVFGATT